MSDKLKKEIVRYLREQGADLVGVATVKTWAEQGIVPEPYRPDSIWPPARSVIVIGLQMPLPIVETTPSAQHMELYRTCNIALDKMAFDLTRWLNRRGHASIFLSRDGYANIDVLIKKPAAAFSHVFAAQYAGLGYVGVNHTILTKEFGPRVRFVSVFTEAELPPDPMLKKPLCIRCRACVECCPVNAFTFREDALVADYNKRACAERAKLLRDKGRYPCGVCIKVCPVGEDRALYGRDKALQHYLREAESLARNPRDPAYASWTHVRRHGGWPLDEEAFPEFGGKPLKAKRGRGDKRKK
ncbi:MAG: epoxyqueuosine reductase [Candidatus Abyssobacteria bacterium SURF_17]|uniref:Epoxyqueuosine reductase n=1 Tax=Candidatus Abyssobacteria bacterium SURF_17 TaxID=2093361 RepID=A0A419EU13_9BACT|nr:MAG: epoxyqueuosine reductase [Candidatus Abyssubacteria bacterium SURF_17]